MAVYYATTQQRTLGRFLRAEDVRLWIRGGNQSSEADRIVPSLDGFVEKFSCRNLSNGPNQDPEQPDVRDHAQPARPPVERNLNGPRLRIGLLRPQFEFQSSEPGDYTPEPSNSAQVKIRHIIYHCFTPAVASVITISAPQMMLTSSLVMLLTALGNTSASSGLATSMTKQDLVTAKKSSSHI
jgi:hypothetical protein